MQAIEFDTTITNGIVRIPKKYHELQKISKATVVVMYENNQQKQSSDDVLEELNTLFENSDNKIMLTMDIATDTSGMMDDGLF